MTDERLADEAKLRELIVRKQKIESQMSQYGQAEQLKAQADIRRKHGGGGLQVWIDEKARMSRARHQLIVSKQETECQISELKHKLGPREKHEKVSEGAMRQMREHAETISELQKQTELLGEIRDLLEHSKWSTS